MFSLILYVLVKRKQITNADLKMGIFLVSCEMILALERNWLGFYRDRSVLT